MLNLYHSTNASVDDLFSLLLYLSNIASFENLFCINYSGRTNGISNALEKFRGNKYLITGSNKVEDSKTVLLQYNMVDKEKSFVSLATTLIPMSLQTLLFLLLEF